MEATLYSSPEQDHNHASAARDKAFAIARLGRKGKRNKPTLNCSECVLRKTKCDRARPSCRSCTRRQTECHYAHISDILIANEASRQRKRRLQMAPGRSSTTPAASKASFGIPSFITPSGLDLASFPALGAAGSPTASHASEKLIHFSLFENKQHPFSNYWTSGGGLSEVVGVLPSKEQADLLVAKYFDALDPIYPIVSRHEFMTEYERFWSLSLEAKCESDPAQIALQFVVYACATLYIDRISPDERLSTGEFYVSASHQALCLFSYLNSCSASTMQTMILLCHFLISSSHISDAWTFSGMTQRQAYGMGLNRNPDSVRPDDSFLEKQQRCKLWQATMFQDTSLSLFLELPPATLYYDIEPNYLRHQSSTIPVSLTPDLSTAPDDVIDIAYLRAMWEYTAFAQTRLCIPKSLRRPISTDAAHKANTISEYRQMFRAWPHPFNSEKSNRFDGWSTRMLRQLISLSSNYFWLLMVLHMDKDESKGIETDIHETLEACHEGMASFFALVRIDPIQADCWSSHHTRAFSQAVAIGSILSSISPHPEEQHLPDARFMLAKSDFERYIDLLTRARGDFKFESMRKKRLTGLESLRLAVKYV